MSVAWPASTAKDAGERWKELQGNVGAQSEGIPVAAAVKPAEKSRLPIPFVVVTTSVRVRQIRSVTTVQVKDYVKKSGLRLVWSKAQIRLVEPRS